MKAVQLYKALKDTGHRELCAKPCAYMELISGMPFVAEAEDPDHLQIRVYLKTFTKVRRMRIMHVYRGGELRGY